MICFDPRALPLPRLVFSSLFLFSFSHPSQEFVLSTDMGNTFLSYLETRWMILCRIPRVLSREFAS